MRNQLTGADVVAAGACASGVREYAERKHPGLTVVPIADLDLSNEHIAKAAGLIGSGYGYGSGSGYGDGYGDGSGDGYGDGYGA